MYKAVIVDDENIVRVALGTIIDWRQYQFEVAGTASNGEEAMKLIRQKQVDLVVTDLKMPAMNGLDLIEILKKEGFEGEIIILSNYDDFEMVRKGLTLGAADYLLKFTISPESFAEVLQKIKTRLDEKRKRTLRQPEIDEDLQKYRELKSAEEWRDILQGRASAELFQTSAYQAQEEKSLVLFYLQVECDELVWNKAEAKEREQFYASITNIIKGLFDGELFLVPLEELALAVVYRTEEKSKFPVEEKAGRIVSLLRNYLNIRADLIFSPWFAAPQEAAAHFSAVQSGMQKRFFTKDAILQEASPLPGEHEQKEYKTLLDSIEEAICSLDSEGYLHQLSKLELFCVRRPVPPDILKKELAALLRKCCKKVLSGRRGGEFPASLEAGLNQASDFDELTQSMKQAFEWIADAGKAVKYEKYRREIAEILQYIDEHAGQKMTLADIAQQVNINESYMCTIFKEQVGTSIISYINEKKMQMAVCLIETTDIYIKEVASRVGISDPFYFNRLFKKYYGVTPSKYKEQILSKRNGGEE